MNESMNQQEQMKLESSLTSLRF